MIVALLLKGEEIKVISAPFLLGFILVVIILLADAKELINVGPIAGDRMETFGVITIAIVMTFQLYRIEVRKDVMPFLKEMLYGGFIFLGTVAILTSGKRGVMLAYLICIVSIMAHSLLDKKLRATLLPYALIAGFLMSLPSVVHDYKRTFENSYDGVHGTIYREDIFALYSAVTGQQVALESTQNNRLPILSSIDYSGTDRIGKYIKIFSLVPENIWFGSGFWGVHFKYHFLPDSGLQVLLETGLLGALLIALISYCVWRGAAESERRTNGVITTAHTTIVLVALAIISLFSNPWYMSRLLMMWIFFALIVSMDESSVKNG
jgi:hypothetical protein